MTEPNMEWEEDFQEFFGNTTDPNKFTEFLSFREVKDFIRQSISQAETRAYEKGKAEERERIAEVVKDERLNEMDSWDVSSKKVLSLIHDNK